MNKPTRRRKSRWQVDVREVEREEEVIVVGRRALAKVVGAVCVQHVDLRGMDEGAGKRARRWWSRSANEFTYVRCRKWVGANSANRWPTTLQGGQSYAVALAPSSTSRGLLPRRLICPRALESLYSSIHAVDPEHAYGAQLRQVLSCHWRSNVGLTRRGASAIKSRIIVTAGASLIWEAASTLLLID